MQREREYAVWPVSRRWRSARLIDCSRCAPQRFGPGHLQLLVAIGYPSPKWIFLRTPASSSYTSATSRVLNCAA